MPIMEWNDDLDIQVQAMNQEHQKLLSIMNRLYDQNALGADKESLKVILTELATYTVTHFSDEEKYMEKIQFPDIKLHKHIHQELLTKFKAHHDAFLAGANSKISPEFFNFLKFWLSAHIQGLDKKYGAFYGQKN